MKPEDFVAALDLMVEAGLIKRKRGLGTWSVVLTKRGRAALELSMAAKA